ncbi:MAG: metallophosphoesterase [Chloroflexota bacterium]
MKILAVSDNVLPQIEDQNNLRRTYGDAEMVISCGDMPMPYLDLIISTLNVPLYFVRGNHDHQYTEGQPGGDNLDGHVKRFKGLTFAGLEGSPRYNDEAVQYSESQMFLKVLAFAPRLLLRRLRLGYGLDVMVTHAPPRDIHDLPDQTHRGFRSLRLLMNWYRPRYLIHGHVDVWDNRRPTRTRFMETEVININPVKMLTIEKGA